MIKIYDTKAREKREFVPVNPGKVGMYVCGPTVYNYIHIGNARTFISFDTIRRYLIWRGFEVVFVQNITDVDDKIITKAKEEGRSAQEVAEQYSAAFIEDMHAAGVLDPDIRPKATNEIDTMIALIEKLIEKQHAYVVDGDVYFSVRSYKAYGQLSHRNIDEMESGHRTLRSDGQGLENRKKDPLDFALWKAAKPGEPSWSSPWGAGRPGWHIECSAMSEKYLHLPFDIHGGGADLAFPHHENERAQSEAAFDCTFANYWMHGGMLQINSEKMSKSLGNFLLLRDILKTTEPAVLRMLMLQTHYRSPLDFSSERLEEARTALGRIQNFLQNASWLCKTADEGSLERDALKNDACTTATVDTVDTVGALNKPFNTQVFEAVQALMQREFIEAMDDDFNTAGALGSVFSFVSEANTLISESAICPSDALLLQGAHDKIVELMGVLGVELSLGSNKEEAFDDALLTFAEEVSGYTGSNGEEAIQSLLDCRSSARKEKNFALADSVRDGLAELGYVIEDTPQGARVRRK